MLQEGNKRRYGDILLYLAGDILAKTNRAGIDYAGAHHPQRQYPVVLERKADLSRSRYLKALLICTRKGRPGVLLTVNGVGGRRCDYLAWQSRTLRNNYVPLAQK